MSDSPTEQPCSVRSLGEQSIMRMGWFLSVHYRCPMCRAVPGRCWYREGTQEMFVNKHPATAQILAVFMVKTPPTNKARFQEPTAGLKQPGRHRVTRSCAGSPPFSRAQATLNIQREGPSDFPCPARDATCSSDLLERHWHLPRPFSGTGQPPEGFRDIRTSQTPPTNSTSLYRQMFSFLLGYT